MCCGWNAIEIIGCVVDTNMMTEIHEKRAAITTEVLLFFRKYTDLLLFEMVVLDCYFVILICLATPCNMVIHWEMLDLVIASLENGLWQVTNVHLSVLS